MDSFDLIVIGAGPGGYVAAIRASQLGLKVACIEKDAALGGTCLRVGCIPSKALLESSQHYARTKALSKHGVLLDGVRLDLAAMMKRKAQVVSMLTKGVESLFRKNEITRISGSAKITAPGTVEVQTDEGPQVIRGKNVLVATGSLPSAVPSLPTDGERVITSTEALQFDEVPQHLVVIGGGYIGLELGSVWRRLGAAVTVIEACDRILPNMDQDLSTEAKRLLSKQGLKFKLNTSVTGLSTTPSGCELSLSNDESMTADKVLIAVGRVPNSKGLGLEALGVNIDDRGTIQVNETFATNIPGIFAIGDVIPGPMLAHKAEEEGVAFAEALVTGSGHVSYETIPGVVFTEPEIATVGKTEQELIESQQAFHKAGFPYRANGRARATDQTEGFAKLLVTEDDQRILGAHVIGAHAGELINEVALAMKSGQSADDLARSCHAHPTFGEVIKEAALTACERGIHS